MGDPRYTSAGLGFADVKELFPDTTISVLKECFEALRLYDLAEILEKVRPHSLRPALSPEQIEKLRRADDRATEYHSDVAVLVVNLSVKGDIVERDEPEKIETFFKDLNSRNEVAISSASSQETREVLREMEQVERTEGYLPIWGNMSTDDVIERLEERIKRNEKKRKVLEKEAEKSISAAMDKWIHNQEKFTCVAVFIISDDQLYTEAVLEECVVEKLALIPDHAKLVVSPYWWKSIAAKVPETLHVMYPDDGDLPVFTRMIEIFNKRWQTLDLISMMQELKRTFGRAYRRYPSIFIKDSLSTLPTFQKKEEEHSI